MSNRSRLYFDPPELLYHLDELVRTKPPGEELRYRNDANHEWIGRARALIGAWDQNREESFNTDCDRIFEQSTNSHLARVNAVGAIARVMNTIQEARSELRLMTGGRVSGSFAGGQPFDIFDELRKVIETAQHHIFIVDPYMGADFVSRYLPHVPQGIVVRLLTRHMIPQLTSALGAYTQQHPMNIEARTSINIHGRFLSIDGARSFNVDASFKDAAKSAPAALIELTDTAASSLSQYETLWQAGTKVY